MYSIYYIDKCGKGLLSKVKGKVGERKRTTELLFKVTQRFAVIKMLHNHVLWRTMTALASGTIAVWMNIFRFDSDVLILDLQFFFLLLFSFWWSTCWSNHRSDYLGWDWKKKKFNLNMKILMLKGEHAFYRRFSSWTTKETNRER